MPIRALLFDAGDTLWYESPAYAAWFKVLTAAGADVDIEAVRTAVQIVSDALRPARLAFETRGSPVSDEELSAHWQRYDSMFLKQLGLSRLAEEVTPARMLQAFLESHSLFPDTRAALDLFRAKGYLMAIVSNGHDQEATARTLDIADYFRVIVGSAHVGVSKPDPRIFHLALEALGAHPAETVMVGDTWDADIVGAQGVGLTPVWIRRPGFTMSSPADASPVTTVADLGELLAHLERRPDSFDRPA